MAIDISMGAFVDEMQKIAKAHGLKAHGIELFSRKGMSQLAKRRSTERAVVRPLKASTVAKKGILKKAEYSPTMGNAMETQPAIKELVARKPRKPGDVPSREMMDTGAVKTTDQRDFTTTIYGQGTQSTNIGAMNYPAEHGL